MLSDIQIAQQTEMLHIRKIAERAGVAEGVSRTVRQLQGQDRPFPLEYIESGRQACARHRHHPHSGGARARPLRPSASPMLCGASAKTASSPCASRPSARCSASRAARRAAATRRWCLWRTSTSTSPVISTPSARPTTCWPPCWTTTSIRATPCASTRAASPGSAAWT